jgi:hypothetical protein
LDLESSEQTKRKYKLRGGIPEGITSQIFAIGGGELVTRETYEIDKLIVQASGRSRPWTLCITAAANDSPEACDAFGNIYGDSLRCRTDYLRLLKGEPGGDDYKRKIARNEIFYFSDGDLETLMNAIADHGIADDLRTAYNRGAVFCGVGAGAAALGKLGFAVKSADKPTVANGIGVVEVGIGCFGEGQTGRTSDAVEAFAGQSVPCFVLEHMTTLHVVEHDYRILAGDKGGAVCVAGGQVREVASAVDFERIESLAATAPASKTKQKV